MARGWRTACGGDSGSGMTAYHRRSGSVSACKMAMASGVMAGGVTAGWRRRDVMAAAASNDRRA